MKVDVILSNILITEAVEKKRTKKKRRKEMWEKKRKLNRKNSLSNYVWLFPPSFSFQRSDCLVTTRTRSTFIGQPDSSTLPKFWACSNFHGSIELRFSEALRSASLFHPAGQHNNHTDMHSIVSPAQQASTGQPQMISFNLKSRIFFTFWKVTFPSVNLVL